MIDIEFGFFCLLVLFGVVIHLDLLFIHFDLQKLIKEKKNE